MIVRHPGRRIEITEATRAEIARVGAAWMWHRHKHYPYASKRQARFARPYDGAAEPMGNHAA
jgi:hypothetical protein